MTSFVAWLERHNAVQRWAQEYAVSQTNPVTLQRVQNDMEAEKESLRKRLGMKRDRGRKIRRGL